MDLIIKKNIRLLAERFNHRIEYNIEELVVLNNLNSIKIIPKNKNHFQIEYNSINKQEIIDIIKYDIYDVILFLFMRTELTRFSPLNGRPLTIDNWIEREGIRAKKEYDQLINDLKHDPHVCRVLFGNTIECEYYKGLFILTDLMRWCKSNVLN